MRTVIQKTPNMAVRTIMSLFLIFLLFQSVTPFNITDEIDLFNETSIETLRRSPRAVLTDIAAVPPNGQIKCHRENTPVLPETHRNIIVGNIGVSDLKIEAKYGLGIVSGYLGLVAELTLKPGQKDEISLTKPFFKTALVFKNPNNTRGVVYSWTKYWPQGATVIGQVSQATPSSQFDFMKYVRLGIIAGSKKVPYVGFILKSIIAEFWPDNKKDKWAEEMEKFQQKLNDVQVSLVKGILKTNLNGYKHRIQTIIRESKKGFNIISHYMNIAEDMIELDGVFFTDPNDTHIGPKLSYFTLPLFSWTINLKVSFYTWGITFAERIGLSSEFVLRIKNYLSEAIENAIKYVEALQKQHEKMTYETSALLYFYNEMMKTRTHVTVHGLEYIPYWRNIIDPEKYPLANNYISYSEFFGTSTFSLYNLTMQNYKIQPLTPDLVPVSPGSSVMRRNKLKTIELYSCWKDGKTLCGMKIRFENDDQYEMGTCQGGLSTVELNDARINRIRVGGGGAIDYIEFYLSDGRYLPFGKGGTSYYVDYELTGHHIVSIFVSNDTNQLARQLANIAVSYQQNPIDDDTENLDRFLSKFEPKE